MLTQIIEQGCQLLKLATETVTKLVTFIDIQKIKGYTGGQAASRFADYLGFLGIADNAVSHEFFASRWTDHRVWIDIPENLRHYVDQAAPLFTPGRLEPKYETRPFYEQGIPQVAPGTTCDPTTGHSVRTAPALTESYSNFIINVNVPQEFYIEVANSAIDRTLTTGFESDPEQPYRLYASAAEARDSLYRELAHSRATRGPRAGVAGDYTLLTVATEHMELNNDLFFTMKIAGRKQSTTSAGYFYRGYIKPKGIRIADENTVG